MVKDYIVLFMNMETGKVGFDTFTDKSLRDATRSFRECYRHEHYKILSIVEKPEINK